METPFERHKSLIEEHKNLKDAYDKVSGQNRQYEENIVELKREVANSEKNYQKLVLARALGLTEQQKKDNDQRLRGMIVKIDKCLDLLNKLNL